METQTELVGGEPYGFVPMDEYIVRASGVCGGRPTFKYTRIEVAGTLDRIRAGENIEAIVSGYKGRISRDALREAVRLSAIVR